MDDAVDIVLADELSRALSGLAHLRLGAALSSTSSTNDVASDLEKHGAQSGVVVMAARQQKGRGRLQRAWITEQRDIAMSIVLRAEHLPTEWSLIAIASAVAIAQALSRLGIDARIKWPNDIVVQTELETLSYFGCFRKVGGVLVENVFSDGRLAASIIGIGINVVEQPLLRAAVPHAACLNDFDGNLRREQVIRALVEQFDLMIKQFSTLNYADTLLTAYRDNCETLGKDVVVAVADGELSGRAIGLDHKGALIIHDGAREHVIHAGDVNLLRCKNV